MPLRQKGASGQVVVWVFHCTKLLVRRRGSRKADWTAEEEGMVRMKGERAGEKRWRWSGDKSSRAKRLKFTLLLLSAATCSATPSPTPLPPPAV